MRAALIVNQVTRDLDVTLAHMLDDVRAAADEGADLVVLPEMAATGLPEVNDPNRDLALGQSMDGPVLRAFAATARERGLHLAVGFLERAGGRLYDSAVLLSPGGRMVLRYRRIHPGWHDRNADPHVYRHGHAVPVASTRLGRFAILICGDLFDDSIIARVRRRKPDWLLFPFARCFSDGSYSQHRWEVEELPSYIAQIKLVGCTALMVNYCSASDLGAYFGGAMVVSGSGETLASLPLGAPGALLVDLPGPSVRRC
jgi:predicted amidohydrolase